MQFVPMQGIQHTPDVRPKTLDELLEETTVIPAITFSAQTLSLPIVWSHQQPNTTTHSAQDEAAARYFTKLDDPHLEDITYVVKDGEKGYKALDSIAVARTTSSAAPYSKRIADYAFNYKPGQVMYHQHPANPQAMIESALEAGNKRFAQQLKQLPRDHPIYTTLMHVPSDADMRTALSVQALGYTKHTHAIEQRIAVMEDGKPIKFLGYGLSEKGHATYRSLVQQANSAAMAYQKNKTRQNHDAMTRTGRQFGKYVESQIDGYKRALAEFQRDIQQWRPEQGQLTAHKFYQRVSELTDFAVEDRGTVGPPITVTPYARAIEKATGEVLTQTQVAARMEGKPIPREEPIKLLPHARPYVLPRATGELPYSRRPLPALPGILPAYAPPAGMSAGARPVAGYLKAA